MFDIQNPLTELHLFAANFSEGLQNACLLLGGPHWLKKVRQMVDRVCSEATLSQTTLRGWREILGLLRLENVHDDTRVEAYYFAFIDPAAPYVEEICLLTEALEDALESYAAAVSVKLAAERMA